MTTLASIMSGQSKEAASCSWEDGSLQGAEQIDILMVRGPREIETEDRCESIHVPIHMCVCEYAGVKINRLPRSEKPWGRQHSRSKGHTHVARRSRLLTFTLHEKETRLHREPLTQGWAGRAHDEPREQLIVEEMLPE